MHRTRAQMAVQRPIASSDQDLAKIREISPEKEPYASRFKYSASLKHPIKGNSSDHRPYTSRGVRKTLEVYHLENDDECLLNCCLTE
ncbi:hypothetical protein MERGE_002302 [Pneumocystis wakefieldiae]|uniref:Uncharacterized protein n=1 Tax=Pneumocystis wakefieldiae TaxID=38082 RepID=A0A899G0W8_9ASCO|nr:hypothetical protein MERGE_002302 [Pneumocystis wakefieldiae]